MTGHNDEEKESQEKSKNKKNNNDNDNENKIDMKQKQAKVSRLSDAYLKVIECIGHEDPQREGLIKTPERAAKAFAFLTKGYGQTLKEVVGEGVFAEDSHNMVIVRDIEFFSLCEHHMVPFMGKVSVGYLPDGKIVGLSKIARIVELFARRLQVQERLTVQVADAMLEAINPKGVAVVIEAAHMCMVMRGVEKLNSKTITSSMLGEFRDNPKTREEFLQLIKS